MAIFRGTGGSGSSSDSTIVDAVTAQATIATTKAGEASTSATTATTKASEASTSATTATTKASEASTSATTASTKATEATTAKTGAETAQTAAEAARDAALGHSNTANSSAVQTVAGSNTQVVGVYNNIANVNTVAGVNTDVTTVAGISSDVTTVAADASDIGTVSTNIANVNNVGNNIANVNAVHGNASNINTVAADGTDIGTIATNIANVNIVAGISSNVTTVAGLESKMDTVIADASDIGAVAGNIGDVTTVAGINSDVDTVAGIAAKVTTVADNITDVQNADTNATNAATSASNASASATSASNSATTATTKATEASNSATAASNSATTATTKASQAAGSATTAGTSASTATTKASEASASATTATTKAGEAASSASAASGDATTATTKASEASASAASASTSATNATNASSTWNNFYTTYLGPADAPPTADVLGNALQTGAFYYDTGAGSNTVGLYVYNGSSWVYSTNYNNVTAPYSLAQDLATNGNDISFGDNAKAKFGASDDLQIWHDGSNSYVKDTGTGYLILGNSDAGTIIKNGSGQNLLTTTASEIRLGHQGNTKLATKSTGIDVTGNVSLPDNAKAQFGAGNDLQIYHDGSNSYVTDAGTGGLYLRGSNEIALRSSSNENIFLGLTDGSAYVYHNGDVKLQTTATGIDVTGNVSADGLTVTSGSSSDNIMQVFGGGTIYAGLGVDGTGAVLTAGSTGSADSDLIIKTSSSGTEKQRARFQDNGDVSFYEDTGTTPKFFWDASTERLGIGTTSPQDALHINSDTTDARLLLDGHTNFDAELKFAENGSVKYTVGHDAATDSFRIGTANVDTNPRLVIDSSGNVGIGTTSADAILHTAKAVNSGDVPNILENAGTSGTCTSSLVFSGNGGGGVEKARIKAAVRGDGFMAFHTNDDTEKMRINSSGNVGIGTASPSQELHIASSGEADIRLQGSSSANHLDIFHNASDFGLWGTGTQQLKLATNNSERLRIDSSGNVLVGKTSQAYATAGLELEGAGRVVATRDGASAGIFARLNSDGDIVNFRKGGTTVGTIGTTGGDMYVGTGDTGIRFDDATNHIRPCGVSGANLDATIDIGDSTRRFKDLYLSKRVYSGNSANTSGNLFLHIDGDADGVSTGYKIRSGVGVTTGSSHVAFVNPNGIVGQIRTDGSATSYNTSSDERLKQNIQDADDAGSKIDAIQVRQFDWKIDGTHESYGVIAQELQSVAPEAVSGNPESEEMMGVDYSKLVPTLIKEIQTLRNRVAQLENN